jgi:hypothetical protein
MLGVVDVEGLAARGADLYVAVACVAGDAKAIEAVRVMLAAEVRFAASKTTASKDQSPT